MVFFLKMQISLKKCEDNNIIFIGPKVSVLKSLGDKITAKSVAIANNIPVIKSNRESSSRC